MWGRNRFGIRFSPAIFYPTSRCHGKKIWVKDFIKAELPFKYKHHITNIQAVRKYCSFLRTLLDNTFQTITWSETLQYNRNTGEWLMESTSWTSFPRNLLKNTTKKWFEKLEHKKKGGEGSKNWQSQNFPQNRCSFCNK